MRKTVIAGNWKMNKTQAETTEFVAELIPMVKDARSQVVLCVPFTNLTAAVQAAAGSNIAVGAQNVAWADNGAFTGEISASMIKETGAEYVIVGHSERRQMFGETDETVAKRTCQALKYGLKPIVCIGETEQQKLDGKTFEVNKSQFVGSLNGVDKEQMRNVIIAYEPVWAIGTGRTATSEDANETIAFIRSVAQEVYGEQVAKDLVIQYGGSMNAGNCQELLAMPDIDGGLIGGASLTPKTFAQIANA